MEEFHQDAWTIGDTYVHPDFEGEVTLILCGEDDCVALAMGGSNDAETRMLAAAPEMLAMLKKAADFVCQDRHVSQEEHEEMEKELRAVISKVTCESSE